MNEQQLMEVFKETSIFNVRSALANNDLLHLKRQAENTDSDLGTDDENEHWAQISGFW